MNEQDPRPFQAISIDMASSEPGRERFVQDGTHTPPPTAAWRCNLTGMSQRYNLYFVASKSGIAVYTPEFPFQKLRAKPKLYIPPTLAEPAARGYIDHHDPHAINHLMVGDLGIEEIMLVATDSGNVAAYHTKSIKEAIEKDPYQFSSDARSDTVGLRAFWSQWVQESAWGLAIHTEARMIAVSANVPHPHRDRTLHATATITVFAFALSDHAKDDAEQANTVDADVGLNDTDWEDWKPGTQGSATFARHTNYRITLRGESGHRTNIPSISFVNTRQDTDGHWLLSTDITGVMKMWQIWNGRCRNEEAGWMVAVLDPGTFRMARTMAQFCGHTSAPKYAEKAGESYDLTTIVQLTVPGRSHRNPFLNAHPDHEESSDNSTDTSSEGEAEDAADHWSEDESSPDDEEVGRPQPTIASIDNDTNDLTTTMLIDTVHRPPEAHPLRTEETSTISPTGVRNTEDILLDVYHGELEDSGEDDVSDSDTSHAVEGEDEGDDDSAENDARSTSSASFASETSLSHVTQRSSVDVEMEPLTLASPRARSPPVDLIKPGTIKKRRRGGEEAEQDDAVLPGIPTLHCTTNHIRLLNAPGARLPHVFCGNILEQQTPRFWRGQASTLRRLNMLQQIPELGIVIIGSQFGRCAICALTRHHRTGTYGLRVDKIVPTKRQEKSAQRPGLWLLGIATAPVQGQLIDMDAEPSPEHMWGEDHHADGIQISFDPGIVALPDYEEHTESGDDLGGPAPRATKRVRRSSATSVNSSSEGSTLQRPWMKPPGMSQYRPSPENRRYRLMMTYADHTVLTYELSRDVGREDSDCATVVEY